jgi:hypothetical protein
MTSRRWDTDERGHGVADARRSLDAIHELAQLAEAGDWVAEDPEAHLEPGLRERVATSGLSLTSVEVDAEGAMVVRLSSAVNQSRREIRQAVWSILGGIAELTTLVRETQKGTEVSFDVVTGIPPGGRFATHGHTLRIELVQL